MRVDAIQLTRHDHAPDVTSIDLADPTDGQVKVRMAYAGVNPIDRYVAEGILGGEEPVPRTLGVEGAGYLDDGQPVVVYGAGLGISRHGTWARHVNVPAETLTPVPDGVDLRQAAAAGVAGRTALRVCRDLADIRAEDRVVVLGATGGVGATALSLARGRGARVWGHTSDRNKAEFLHELGVSSMVTGVEDLPDSLRKIDPTVVLDPLGGGYTAAAIEALHPGGRLVLYGTSAQTTTTLNAQQLYRKSVTVFGYGGAGEPLSRTRTAIADTLEALRDHHMSIPISEEVSAERANEALDLLRQRGVRGKAVLTFGGNSPQRDQ